MKNWNSLILSWGIFSKLLQNLQSGCLMNLALSSITIYCRIYLIVICLTVLPSPFLLLLLLLSYSMRGKIHISKQFLRDHICKCRLYKILPIVWTCSYWSIFLLFWLRYIYRFISSAWLYFWLSCFNVGTIEIFLR